MLRNKYVTHPSYRQCMFQESPNDKNPDTMESPLMPNASREKSQGRALLLTATAAMSIGPAYATDFNITSPSTAAQTLGSGSGQTGTIHGWPGRRHNQLHHHDQQQSALRPLVAPAHQAVTWAF
jgi:hypothetical protein